MKTIDDCIVRSSIFGNITSSIGDNIRGPRDLVCSEAWNQAASILWRDISIQVSNEFLPNIHRQIQEQLNE